MCEQKLEADEWVNEFQFLACQTASEAWSSFRCSFQTARTQNPYCQHFSHENVFLCSEHKHSHFGCSFQKRWQMQTSPRLANFFFLDPLMIYWEKQKVIWCARWEERCWRSDMGAGVRPVLFNGRRHFWLKASCWEPTLSTYANLKKAHPHINPFLLVRAHTTARMRSERFTRNKSKRIREPFFL